MKGKYIDFRVEIACNIEKLGSGSRRSIKGQLWQLRLAPDYTGIHYIKKIKRKCPKTIFNSKRHPGTS